MRPAPSLFDSHIFAGSPLRRPGFAQLTVGALLIALAFASFMVLRIPLQMSVKPDMLMVYLTAIGIAAVISLFPLTILWFLDRRERESPWLFVAAFLWGGLLATGLALPLNQLVLGWVSDFVAVNPELEAALGENAVLMLGAPIAGPLVEELTKGIGVLLLFALLRGEFDNMRDGLIYGALIGLGFTWIETPLYIAKGYAEYGFAPWNFQFGYRYALLGLSGHPLYTALFGAALGLARQVRARWLRWLLPPIGLLLGMAAHALNNGLGLITVGITGQTPDPAPAEEAAAGLNALSFPQAWLGFSLMQLVIFLPFLVIAWVALYRSGLWERRTIREELATECPPVVTPEELEAINRDRAFRTRRVGRGDSGRSVAIVRAQHELAFRKRRVRTEGGDPDADPLVASWRAKLARLRS